MRNGPISYTTSWHLEWCELKPAGAEHILIYSKKDKRSGSYRGAQKKLTVSRPASLSLSLSCQTKNIHIRGRHARDKKKSQRSSWQEGKNEKQMKTNEMKTQIREGRVNAENGFLELEVFSSELPHKREKIMRFRPATDVPNAGNETEPSLQDWWKAISAAGVGGTGEEATESDWTPLSLTTRATFSSPNSLMTHKSLTRANSR